MKRALLILLVACACPSKSTSGPSGGSGSSAQIAPPPPTDKITSCETARGKIEALYRAEAEAKQPKRVDDRGLPPGGSAAEGRRGVIDEAVADNTAMVLADCAKAPDRVVPCLAAAETLADVEKKCLVQLDDEGTEGEQPK